MDGDPAEGLSASEWAARLDELKGMSGELAMRIDDTGGDADGPDDPAGAAADTPAAGGPAADKPPEGWRERLMWARRSPGRGSRGGPANDGPGR